MGNNLIDFNDLNLNQNPRLPICFCIDVSEKVGRSRLPQISEMLNRFISEIKNNYEFSAKIQLSLVIFADETKVVNDFCKIDNFVFENDSIVQMSGLPKLSKALNCCIDRINDVISLYRSKDLNHYCPRLVLLSSGETYDDLTNVSNRLYRAGKKILIINHSSEDHEGIKPISSLNNCLNLDGDLNELFDCLFKSDIMISSSSASAFDRLFDSAE